MPPFAFEQASMPTWSSLLEDISPEEDLTGEGWFAFSLDDPFKW